MGRTPIVRPQFAVLVGFALLAACVSEPISPEEQRAREIETYCRTVADAARTDQSSQGGGQLDEIGKDDDVWQDLTAGSSGATRSQAAFAECMNQNQPE